MGHLSEFLTTEGNKLIAEFMGVDNSVFRFWKVGDVSGNNKMFDLPYHEDWKLLMPVVETIEERHEVIIKGVFCEIMLSDNGKDKWFMRTIKKDADTKIKAVWLAVIEFLDYYNEED